MNFTKLLNKTANILSVTETTNAIGEVIQTADTIKATYPTRYEKMGAVKIVEGGYTTNLDDYLFYFNSDASIDRNDHISVDGIIFDIKQVESINGRSSVHHVEVIATKRDHE